LHNPRPRNAKSGSRHRREPNHRALSSRKREARLYLNWYTTDSVRRKGIRAGCDFRLPLPIVEEELPRSLVFVGTMNLIEDFGSRQVGCKATTSFHVPLPDRRKHTHFLLSFKVDQSAFLTLISSQGEMIESASKCLPRKPAIEPSSISLVLAASAHCGTGKRYHVVCTHRQVARHCDQKKKK
jgi:hypothetical protein